MSNNRPHIAFYLYGFYDGGAERIMINLMHSLVQRGVKIDLIVNAKTKSPYLSMLPSEVKFLAFDVGYKKGLPKLISYLQQVQPQALLSSLHYSTDIAILAKRFSRVATKVVVREANHLSTDSQNSSSLKERLTPLASRLTYPWADAIVAVSQGVAKNLTQITGLPLSRINVIYNPTITPQMLTKSTEPLDHPWFQSGEPPVILAVGRLEPQKDFPTLIRAFAQVRKTTPARLLILGSGKEKFSLEQLISELGLENDVAMPGFVKNPYNYMKQATVFVLSSAWEGLPNVLIEAMALGTPVVATNCPSGPEEILANGKYGNLVPVGDVDKMAKAMAEVMSGNFQPVDSSWLQQFTLETAIDKYLDILGIAT